MLDEPFEFETAFIFALLAHLLNVQTFFRFYENLFRFSEYVYRKTENNVLATARIFAVEKPV